MQKVKEYASFNGEATANENKEVRFQVPPQQQAPQQPGYQPPVYQQPAYQQQQPYYQPQQQQQQYTSPRYMYSQQRAPQQVQKTAVHDFRSEVPNRTIEKIVKPEKDLVPKYTIVEEAINSVLRDGDYYEDYVRGGHAELLKSKEFVLCAIAQNHNRFYAPETPKPSDWLDEEYMTERISYFFEMTREGIQQDENIELAENLYNYFRKFAFSAESHRIVNDALRLVAKVNAARIYNVEEGGRLRNSLNLFNQAVDNALNIAKEKYFTSVEKDRIRAERLAAEKNEIVGIIDNMRFDF